VKDVEVETVNAVLSKVGESISNTVWHKTTIATATPLTVAQRQADILRQTVRCGGSGSKKYCIFYYLNDFTAADVKTLRAENAEKGHALVDGTIFQDRYRPTIGVPFEEMRSQNGNVELAKDCLWTKVFDGWKVTDGPKAFVTAVGSGDFHEIVTSAEEAKPTGD
jgi:hypothetical protein